MKKITFLFSAFILTVKICQGHQSDSKDFQPPKAIEVQFNRNVEFLGFTFFLGSLGSQFEYNEEVNNHQIKWKDWYAYDMALYHQYKSFLGNENLNTARQFIERTDGTDLFLLFLQLEDFPNAKLDEDIEEKYYLVYSEKGDPEEAKRNASLFIDALNQFYTDLTFDSYFRENKKKYEHALQQIKDNLPDDAFIPAMEEFYKISFDEYVLVPSLTIPTGMGFGAKLEKEGKSSIYNIFGPLDVQRFENDAQLDMGFGNKKRLRELSTHEFGHSFVNQAIDHLPTEILQATESLFEPIKTAMVEQSYINWKYCLGEHFVRAGEVLIAQNLGKTKEAEALKADYIENRKFIYLPIILEELEKYDNDKRISYQEGVNKAMKKLKRLAKQE